MSDNRDSIHRLIICRFSFVCALIVATRLALPTGSLLDKLFPYFLGTAVLTAFFLLLWKYSDRDNWLYQLQFYTDLVLVTSLILFSGGVDSPFAPVYVLIIVYASLFKGRSGGVLALVLSVVSFALTANLSYFDLLPGPQGPVDLEGILYRFSINLLVFISVAFLGIYLSERLQTARQELGSARVIQQNIVDSIRSGLLTLNEAGQINFANRVGAEILGCQRDELLALNLDEVFPPHILSRVKEHDYGTTSRALRMEEWVKTRRGDTLFVGMGCSPLIAQETQRIGFVISFQDLTEIKEREEDYQFREKMAAIGEMAAGLAHELRNPLGSLSGSIQILRSELTLSQDQSRLLDIVLRESERLNRIVGNFLTYAGPQTSVRQQVDLWGLVEETVQLLQNSPEFLNEKHTLQLNPGTGERHCRGNPDQFRQVIWNVLQNGIRAMPDEGVLSISLVSRNHMLVLRVQDTGIGMTKSAQERLFQPFHSGFPKGAGLGMAIVYQIVRQHQGRIEVESAPKIGTRIEILLPKQ